LTLAPPLLSKNIIHLWYQPGIIVRRKSSWVSSRPAPFWRSVCPHQEPLPGLGWSFPCDAYSLGCILVEFFTGLALYQTHDNLEHLAMMEVVMGKIPERFARAGARSKPDFFKEGGKLDWPKPKATRQSKKDVKATRPLQVSTSPPGF